MNINTPNNEYYYDNNTGLIMTGYYQISSILNIENWETKSNNEIISLLKNEFDETDISFYHTWMKKYINFHNTFLQDFKIEDVNIPTIQNTLLRMGFKQLILSITNECNFRCTYCVYSDE